MKILKLRWIDVIIVALFIPPYIYNPYIQNAFINILFPNSLCKNIKHPPNNDNFYSLIKTATETFKLTIKGVIHIGANEGQEKNIYKTFNINNILWIEADPKLAQTLNDSINHNDEPGIQVANFAASNVNKQSTFFKTNNNGLSSSILKLKKHKTIFPSIVQTEEFPVTLKKLDSYFIEQEDPNNKTKYNFLVLDIQGAELLALEGAKNTLKQIDGIISEVNYDELYENCATIEKLDLFLLKHNFIRVDTKTEIKGYGNALYINKKFLEI